MKKLLFLFLRVATLATQYVYCQILKASENAEKMIYGFFPMKEISADLVGILGSSKCILKNPDAIQMKFRSFL